MPNENLRHVVSVDRRTGEGGAPVWVAVLDDGSHLAGITSVEGLDAPSRDSLGSVNVLILGKSK